MTKTILITGASDGIGAAAARQLSANGHQVVLIGRDPEKTQRVARELDAPFHLADFTELAQVRRLGEELDRAYPRIDVLANNAGGIMGERRTTVDGFEKTFQVNHLAGFLLTTMLMPKLLASRASVIQTSSLAAKLLGAFDLTDLQSERKYSPQRAYGNAKLANILFTRELHRRFSLKGLSAAAFHPGVIASNFAHDTTPVMRYLYHAPFAKRILGRPERGADQLVWLAEGTPGDTWLSGRYYEKRTPARSAATAHDPEAARELWDRSSEMVHGRR